MKRRIGIQSIILLGIMVLSLFVGFVSAVPMPPGPEANKTLMSEELINLTLKGYDVTQIETVLESGNISSAEQLLAEFMQKNPEAISVPQVPPQQPQQPPQGQPPAPPANTEKIGEELKKLSSKGYDISDIESVLSSDGIEIAEKLLKEFMEDNPEAASSSEVLPQQPQQPPQGQPPAPPADTEKIGEELKNLSSKGYDISDIESVLSSDGIEIAEKLLKEFMEDNPEAASSSEVPPQGQPPAPPADTEKIGEELKNLSSQGYNVSGILVVLEGGNITEALFLLTEFMQKNPEAVTSPPDLNTSAKIQPPAQPVPVEADINNTRTPDRSMVPPGVQSQESGPSEQDYEDLSPSLDVQVPQPPSSGQEQGPPTDPEIIGQLLSDLSSQGYDVTDIQDALENEDMETVQTLLEEFFTQYPNLRPTPPSPEFNPSMPGFQ